MFATAKGEGSSLVVVCGSTSGLFVGKEEEQGRSYPVYVLGAVGKQGGGAQENWNKTCQTTCANKASATLRINNVNIVVSHGDIVSSITPHSLYFTDF